jgi:methyltransferase (TIGR00027 family)
MPVPASQGWKRARLSELAIQLPGNLTFVPLAFEKRLLAEALRTNGYRVEAPAFFSWLGVTCYLTDDAIFKTLRTVASMATGTEIIFDYALPLSLLGDEARQAISAIMSEAASRAEPLISFFEPQNLAARLRELGFAEVWDFDLGSKKATAPYFAGRSDELRLPTSGVFHLMGARVGPRS